MEQVNILITHLKKTKLIDGLLSVVGEGSFMDTLTLKKLIVKGLDTKQHMMKESMPGFTLVNAAEQLMNLLVEDEKVNLRYLKDLVGVQQEDSEFNYMGTEKVS
jgi:hypothetical protein